MRARVQATAKLRLDAATSKKEGRSLRPRPARRFIAMNQLSGSTSPDSTINVGLVLTR